MMKEKDDVYFNPPRLDTRTFFQLHILNSWRIVLYEAPLSAWLRDWPFFLREYVKMKKKDLREFCEIIHFQSNFC